jgi:hypothetical protein
MYKMAEYVVIFEANLYRKPIALSGNSVASLSHYLQANNEEMPQTSTKKLLLIYLSYISADDIAQYDRQTFA